MVTMISNMFIMKLIIIILMAVRMNNDEIKTTYSETSITILR